MIIWGMIGLILIGAGWIPQVIEIIKTKHSNLNLGFALLYTLGSLALTIHSINLQDISFIILNAFALFMGTIGLYYTIISRRTRKEVKRFLEKLKNK
jgi:lipid-A-disaccharide synthase-like uncharacterized protein